MNSTEISEKIIVPIVAAFIGALAAFRYQRVIELKREKRAIIQVLMMYRNVGASELEWIKAMNVIDLVYANDKKVTVLYHTFLAATRPEFFSNKQYVEIFYSMLFEMGQCSGYKSLTLERIRDFYAPEALDLHYPNRNAAPSPTTDSSDKKQ